MLKRFTTGLDLTEAKVLECNVAFHHSELTTEERDIVEVDCKGRVALFKYKLQHRC